MSLFIGFGKRKSLYSTSVTRDGPPQFRLMKLDPGPWDQPLRCTLQTLPLNGAPHYKALSYAWDNGLDSSTSEPANLSVECNGISVAVSSNLYAALKRLRDVESPVHVWVDAICINQRDDLERTHQVQLMRDIYRKSHEVAIWLSEETKHDDVGQDLVLQNLEASGALSCIDWKGDMSDKPLWDTFRQRQETRKDNLDLRNRDIFGAFCVLWLLSIGVAASEIMHLRHIAQSITILYGIDAIREQPWVGLLLNLRPILLTLSIFSGVGFGLSRKPWSPITLLFTTGESQPHGE